MLFADRKEITINGKTLVIRQRSIQDIINIERSMKRYSGNTTGTAIVLAFMIKDALKYDNERYKLGILKKLFPINIKWVLKNFSLAEMQKVQKEITDLESYQEKKNKEKA